jgi:hypothetical protein
MSDPCGGIIERVKTMQKMIGGKNVISMLGYKTETLFTEINEVRAYWEGLRMGRIVPRRSEIDPRGIERALSNTFILERIAMGMARVRLTGSHLNDLLGMEVRGMPFTAFFTPTARDAVTKAMQAVFEGPEIAELSLKAERRIGKPTLDAKLILLPLRSDMGEISRIIGCFVSSGVIGRAPRRFYVSKLLMKPLMVEGESAEFTKKPLSESVGTEHQNPQSYRESYRGSEKPAKNKSRLHLVVSNDRD